MAASGNSDQDPPGPPWHDLSPEGRRREALLHHHAEHRMWPGSRVFEIVRRVLVGTYHDGFIHAGNLAYMSMLAIFPFFITGAAIFSLVGEESERAASIGAILSGLPPIVSDVIEPVARKVVEQRSGWLLWVGGLFGLWTVSSLIETIRDILRRAYGTRAAGSFWKYRLFSTGLIVAAVILVQFSLLAQVLIGTAHQVISDNFPQLDDMLAELSLSRIVPAIVLFGSLWLLFYTLSPGDYRSRRYRKWPGALLVTIWWAAVSVALPQALKMMISYDKTYGSLAGIMIALFFFWLVGLGMVMGAELNAALAVTPEEEEEEGRFGHGYRNRLAASEEQTMAEESNA